jgi:excisionase family DNA binding protein
MSTNFQSQEVRQERRLTYSIAEAARMCGVSRATLYRLLARGQLSTVKIGSRRLVPERSIETLLAGGTQ